MLIQLKQVAPIKKLPINKIESFLKSIFDLNLKSKIVPTQNHQFWNFNVTDLFCVFIQIHRNALELLKMPKIRVGRRLV